MKPRAGTDWPVSILQKIIRAGQETLSPKTEINHERTAPALILSYNLSACQTLFLLFFSTQRHRDASNFFLVARQLKSSYAAR